jgi:hypothetical protein
MPATRPRPRSATNKSVVAPPASPSPKMRPRGPHALLLVALAAACWPPPAAAGGAGAGAAPCAAADLHCACVQAGGVWHQYRRPLEPLCTFTIMHQGVCARALPPHLHPSATQPRAAPPPPARGPIPPPRSSPCPPHQAGPAPSRPSCRATTTPPSPGRCGSTCPACTGRRWRIFQSAWASRSPPPRPPRSGTRSRSRIFTASTSSCCTPRPCRPAATRTSARCGGEGGRAWRATEGVWGVDQLAPFGAASPGQGGPPPKQALTASPLFLAVPAPPAPRASSGTSRSGTAPSGPAPTPASTTRASSKRCSSRPRSCSTSTRARWAGRSRPAGNSSWQGLPAA